MTHKDQLINEPKQELSPFDSTLKLFAKDCQSVAPGEIKKLGNLLSQINTIEDYAPETIYDAFSQILSAAKSYTEELIMEEAVDTVPLAEAADLLVAIRRAEINNKDFSFGIDGVLEMLGYVAAEATESLPPEEAFPGDEPAEEQAETSSDARRPLGIDDIEIMKDFILESNENLDKIEINLINLEESPTDKTIINEIFRPFHTIKGVSGFLDLTKINELTHHTENLFDAALSDELYIDSQVTDIILDSVDILKQLLDTIEEGVASGFTPADEHINIKPITSQIESLLTQSSKAPKKLGEILVERGDISDDMLDDALEKQRGGTGHKIGEILVSEKKTSPQNVISALRDQKTPKITSHAQVKVDTEKLDDLVDLTGELVIAQSILRQNTSILASQDQKLLQNINQLGQSISNIQHIAMSMRMVPVKHTFQRMIRLVRDLSKSCGKKVSLHMSGEDTEIDRTMVEALYEPMVHMIRNAIDHGLESPEERTKTNKMPVGNIHLRAFHRAGSIIIEINDDGRGLNKKKIVDKAVERGVISADSKLSDAKIFSLIMAPGFSTAVSVTDISGRGVGMDVVKKNIDDINGKVEISSVLGEGTTFTISLPLTLAMIEGMLTRSGGSHFIIPALSILEAFKPGQKDYHTISGKGEMVMFRKNLIPLLRIAALADRPMNSDKPWDNIVVVVENRNVQKGLLIEELLGKQEFVIKNLGETFQDVKGFAGGAIMGNGRIGLILDIGELFEMDLTTVFQSMS